MTQRLMALEGRVSPEMEIVARAENLAVEEILHGLAEGSLVIPKNKNRSFPKPIGIGKNLRVKTNANLGTSPQRCDLDYELKKLAIAVKAGADTIMDLSVGGDIPAIRRKILESCEVPLGTVPIYEAAVKSKDLSSHLLSLSVEDIFAVILEQAQEGVDFMTVHCGLTQQAIQHLRQNPRICSIVSRGGAMLAQWMVHQDRENPLYENFDRLLEIAVLYDVTISLGDGLRPGSIADATDAAQLEELMVLGHLTKRAWQAGVQVMIEGPGHIPLNLIETNVKIQKALCHGAPFYVLGPLVTDIAAGYDHITAAIGGALAAWAGADFLCYVTPAEHLRLPTLQDVKDGVIATRLAGHAADLARGLSSALARDYQMSLRRRNFDWEGQQQLALDPEKFKDTVEFASVDPQDRVCSMCGEYCAMKTVKDLI